MCLAIPHKIIKIKGQQATVACGKKTHTLDIRLVPKVKAGDYVMNENQFAIYKLTKKEAQETLKLLSQFNSQ
ncbi:MAG: HypC/HybG/HupF family hydrogenase formation chaperone [Patescibacteria group bacterium]|jgi:hydrogenase expression/formation protein HypC